MIRVLVACEFTGVVRDAFTREGVYAMSSDLRETETPGEHYKGDVRDVLDDNWDLLIAHPPCHDIASSGARWFKAKKGLQRVSLDFVLLFFRCGIPRICIENPVGLIGTKIRKASQYVHPWMFGDPFEKKTGLWLKNLPKLVPTNVVEPPPREVWRNGKTYPKWMSMSPGEDRRKERSRTFPGMAKAMADQFIEYIARRSKTKFPINVNKPNKGFFDV